MKNKIKNLDKETKRRIKILLVAILGIIVLISGMSYAFVKLSYTSEKVENINSCFDITMSDSGALSLNNAIPTQDTVGINGSPYTYTITNTCDLDAYYETTINVISSNTSEASKVRVALYGDGYLAPSTLSTLKTGELTANFTNPLSSNANYAIDEGYLPAKTSKTFKLAMWLGYDTTSFSGDFKTKVLVTGIAKEAATLTNLSGGSTIISNNTVINDTDYSSTSTNGLYYLKRNDDLDTFYFRGTSVNNYMTFAGKEWRVVRINKDGSIKIVLNDSIGNSTYTNIDSTLNTWYNSNIKGTDYEKYVVSDSYCNDTTFAYKRVVTNNKPKLTCSTTTNKSIGILSVDEVMLSSAIYNSTTKSSYLDSSTKTYTLTPGQTNNDVFAFGGTTQISLENKTSSLGIRPSITLTKEVVLSGVGSSSNKYSVTGLYSNKPAAYNDTTAPVVESASVEQTWTNTGKEITLSGFDESKGSGVSAYIITTSTSTPSSNDSNWVSMSSNKVTTTTKYNAGTYYIWVKDASNNISNYKQLSIDKIDTTKPSCTLTYATTGNGYRLKVTGSDNNALAGKPYSFDGTTYQELSTKEVTSTGTYTAYVKDLAGNVNSCSVKITALLDAKTFALSKVGTDGLETVTHTIDSTLQVGSEFATEYRYRGGDSTVKNYVTFNNETWRIIGILPTEDTDGNVEYRFKIIRDTSIGSYYWNSTQDTTTSSYNNWVTGTLNTYLNGDYYNSLTSESQNMIGTAKYYLGGFSTSDITSDVMWQYERKNDANRSGYYYGTNPVVQNDANKKIALMYASDYGYGASTSCASALVYYAGSDYNSSTECNKTNNWLDKSLDEWILPQNSSRSIYAFVVCSSGYVENEPDVRIQLAARPVLHLTSKVKIKSGTGISSDPYILGVS